MDEETLKLLGATAELLGASLTPGALNILADDLSSYPPESITIALRRMRKDGARFVPAEIIKRLPGMWPGAEQAWAQFPRDESQSACVCQEMLTAWGVAEELDEIQGRMAFKETYNRLVSEGMAEDRQPEWQMSLGHDAALREQATLDAVSSGLLAVDNAVLLVPHIPESDLHKLANGKINSHRLIENHAPKVASLTGVVETAVEENYVSKEEGRRQAQLLRQALNGCSPLEPEKPETLREIDSLAKLHKVGAS